MIFMDLHFSSWQLQMIGTLRFATFCIFGAFVAVVGMAGLVCGSYIFH